MLEEFENALGAGAVLSSAEAMAPYLSEWRGLFHGQALAVLRPSSTQAVSDAVRLAARHRLKIVPQGGNTGLVGGQIPDDPKAHIILSAERLSAIRKLDSDGNSITVEAGVVLERIQQAADAAERFFPLALGAQGSCQIGGNISTNAGGTGVLAYGNTRNLVLGLEVVLADGRIWNGLRALHKNNTGYDLKQLFIGGEGTLGFVTAAVLKLFPKPRGRQVAFMGFASPHAALATLNIAQGLAGSNLTGEAGEAASDKGHVADAVLATSSTQQAEFWRMRHGLSEVQKHEGGSIKHDVSVPVSRMPDFIVEASAAVEAIIPNCRPVAFGHLGDGNIHFNVSQPIGGDKQAFLAEWDRVNTVVHDIVANYDGSVSAEHGIGRLKAKLMPQIKSDVELDMMRKVKQCLDPDGLFNPGALLPPEL